VTAAPAFLTMRPRLVSAAYSWAPKSLPSFSMAWLTVDHIVIGVSVLAVAAATAVSVTLRRIRRHAEGK
jgi:hypothetical protein